MKKKAVSSSSNSSKSSKSKGLSTVSAGAGQQISVEAVLAHPVFQEVSQRLAVVQGMLKGLPAAIGQAVAAALASPPEGSSGPALPMVGEEAGREIEITKGQLKVGDQVYNVPKDGINRMKLRQMLGAITKAKDCCIADPPCGPATGEAGPVQKGQKGQKENVKV